MIIGILALINKYVRFLSGKVKETGLANSLAELAAVFTGVIGIIIAVISFSVATTAIDLTRESLEVSNRTLEVAIDPNINFSFSEREDGFIVSDTDDNLTTRFVVKNQSPIAVENIVIYIDYFTYHATSTLPTRFLLCPVDTPIDPRQKTPIARISKLYPKQAHEEYFDFKDGYNSLVAKNSELTEVFRKNEWEFRPGNLLMRVRINFQRSSDKRSFSNVKVFEILHLDSKNFNRTMLIDFDQENFFGPKEGSKSGLEILPISKELREEIKETPLPIYSLFCSGMLENRFEHFDWRYREDVMPFASRSPSMSLDFGKTVL